MSGAAFPMTVSGPAAFLLARVIDPKKVEQRLDDLGFRGSPKAEAWRAEVMSTLERIAGCGDAWHAAQRGDEPEPTFTLESDVANAGRQLQDMYLNTYTQKEVAEILGVSPQRVGQLRDDGQLLGFQDKHGHWLYDRDEIQGLKEDREESLA